MTESHAVTAAAGRLAHAEAAAASYRRHGSQESYLEACFRAEALDSQLVRFLAARRASPAGDTHA